ncbi:hypothetical protein JR316_0013014 [Psilocybe cubensis]|uniref:F-box domain-containing protein n=2 Tax=Psilocybe cubensis TaxID=181762 RepID=A0A8H8CHH0_PSICU|nr:hypothetical protein JR316_0013014 [Psilocybe cubensis]KAH9474552.1 hypothetical protein JR316_0013014 [Psilocybe cubensis]
MGIADLPAELLFEVASHLDQSEGPEQARLALTCRWFYTTLMRGVAEYQSRQFEVLLQRAVITPSLQASPLSAVQLDKDSANLKLFERPFSDLVVHATHLDAADTRSLRYIICQSKHLQSVEIAIIQPLRDHRHLAAVMGTCFGKTGLHLRITGSFSGDQSPFSFQFHSNGQSIQIASHPTEGIHAVSRTGIWPNFRYFFRRFLALFPAALPSTPISGESPLAAPTPTVTFTVTQRKPKFHISSLPTPQLESLHLDGALSLLQSVYPVTLKALNSQMTSLTLQRISFSIFDWNQILPSISLPVLKTFTLIGDLTIAFPDLLMFFERHQSIEHLYMTDKNLIGMAKMPLHSILPNLNTLGANSEYLTPFLQYKRLGHLPALRYIHISSIKTPNGPSMTRYPYPCDDLYPVYELMSDPHFSDLWVTIDALRPSGLMDWILFSKFANRDGNSFVHLAGVKVLTVKSQDMSISVEATQKLEEWKDSAGNPGGISQPHQDNKAMDSISVMENLIWVKCAQLETLQLGV